MPAKKAKKITQKDIAKKPVAAKNGERKKPLDVALQDCEHCQGVGKCTAGELYDKGHHQLFGSKVFLTSCVDCLEVAGEHTNSKKIVICRVCKGTGKAEA